MKKLIFAFASTLVFASVVLAQAGGKTDTERLRSTLQAKLNEWHKAGKFPGATLGGCPRKW